MRCNSCHKRRSKGKLWQISWPIIQFQELWTLWWSLRWYCEVNVINASPEEQVWQLFFDGASRTNPEGNIVAGVEVVLISPHNYVIPYAFSLTKSSSNNVSENNALLIGMQLAEEIGVKNLEAYGDSKLIINHVCGEYKVWHEDLVPYHNVTIIMTKKFETSTLAMYRVSKMHM